MGYENTYYLLLAEVRWARLWALGRLTDECSSLLVPEASECFLSFFACFLALCFLTARINNMIMVAWRVRERGVLVKSVCNYSQAPFFVIWVICQQRGILIIEIWCEVFHARHIYEVVSLLQRHVVNFVTLVAVFGDVDDPWPSRKKPLYTCKVTWDIDPLEGVLERSTQNVVNVSLTARSHFVFFDLIDTHFYSISFRSYVARRSIR
jgi:hypothetical protein